MRDDLSGALHQNSRLRLGAAVLGLKRAGASLTLPWKDFPRMGGEMSCQRQSGNKGGTLDRREAASLWGAATLTVKCGMPLKKRLVPCKIDTFCGTRLHSFYTFFKKGLDCFWKMCYIIAILVRK